MICECLPGMTIGRQESARLTGSLFDRGHLRILLLAGSFLVVSGHMMLSICSLYWQIILAQAVVIGSGTGLLFVPCMAILSQYFTSKLGLAVGIAVLGSSLGDVIIPILLCRLINQVGFPWAVRVESFVALTTLSIPLWILRLRI